MAMFRKVPLIYFHGVVPGRYLAVWPVFIVGDEPENLGENGYAALNVLTDFASRPVGFISQEGRIDSLQHRAGGWIEDFVEAMESRDFKYEDYLGDFFKMVT